MLSDTARGGRECRYARVADVRTCGVLPGQGSRLFVFIYLLLIVSIGFVWFWFLGAEGGLFYFVDRSLL